jgi:hypothetical protein
MNIRVVGSPAELDQNLPRLLEVLGDCQVSSRQELDNDAVAVTVVTSADLGGAVNASCNALGWWGTRRYLCKLDPHDAAGQHENNDEAPGVVWFGDHTPPCADCPEVLPDGSLNVAAGRFAATATAGRTWPR